MFQVILKWCKARHEFFIAVTKILLQKVFIVETVLEEQCANANAPSSLPSKTHTNQSLICNTHSPSHPFTPLQPFTSFSQSHKTVFLCSSYQLSTYIFPFPSPLSSFTSSPPLPLWPHFSQPRTALCPGRD